MLRRLLVAVCVVTGLITVAAFVLTFYFAYTAALTPGPDPEAVNACVVSLLLTVCTGVLTCVSGAFAVDA